MIRADFFRPRTPEKVIGSVVWDGRLPRIQAKNSALRDQLARIFRPTAVAVEDAASLPVGASGPTILEPGDLEWFFGAARVRGREERLGVRFVTEMEGGWDPAGAYRPMRLWVEDFAAGKTSPTPEELGTVTEA